MFSNRISLKIAFWYTLSFLGSALLLFALTGYLLQSSLQKKDQNLLEIKFQVYSSLLQKEGVSGLKQHLTNSQTSNRDHFLVRYQDSLANTALLHIPESMEIGDGPQGITQIERELRSEQGTNTWFSLSGPEYGDSVEILSRTIPAGGFLQVGKDIEDREEFFEQYVSAFLIELIPVMIFAILISFVISGKLLKPIRWLTQTIQSIRSGQSGARVPLSGNQDELDQLGSLFNQMQEQNEGLVQGMKDTLDHVAHDLRTPLMRLQNSAQSALQETDPLATGTPWQEALIECQENAEIILKMLNAIMDISEAETGTLALKKEIIVVAQLIENVLDLYELVAEEKSLTVLTEASPNLQVIGDRGRLLQALANLVDNAIKFSPENANISIKAYSQIAAIVIEVKDQDTGIPQNEQSKIWTRLYRGDNSRSTPGLGLGLSLVKAIIQAHQGSIEVVNNSPETGNTFRINLPLS